MRNKKSNIPAFTVFEIVVVIAIMGVLITIITNSLTRFNQQIKITGDIHNELNEFYRVRSAIWTDLYDSDSVVTIENGIRVFKQSTNVDYTTVDDVLQIERQGAVESTAIKTIDISIKNESKHREVYFLFDWKDEEMILTYPYIYNVDVSINKFYEGIKYE